MKKFIIFSLLTSISTGLVAYFKSPHEEDSFKASAERPAQLEDIVSLKPSSTVYAHGQPLNKEIAKNESLIENKPLTAPQINITEQVSLSNTTVSSLETKPVQEKPGQVKQTSAQPSLSSSERITSLQGNTSSQSKGTQHEIPLNELNLSISTLISLAEKDPRAAYDLSLRYFRGDGVRQDSYQALKLMRDAAERGDLIAQKEIGKLYMTGLEEMGSDFQEAKKWLSIAVSKGDKEAKALLQEVEQAHLKERSNYRYTAYGYVDLPYRMYWLSGHWYYY